MVNISRKRDQVIKNASLGLYTESELLILALKETYKNITKKNYHNRNEPHVGCLQCSSGFFLWFKLYKCKISSDPNIQNFAMQIKVPLQIPCPGMDRIKVDDKQGFCGFCIDRSFRNVSPSVSAFLLQKQQKFCSVCHVKHDHIEPYGKLLLPKLLKQFFYYDWKWHQFNKKNNWRIQFDLRVRVLKQYLGPLNTESSPLPSKLCVVKSSNRILSISFIFHVDKSKSCQFEALGNWIIWIIWYIKQIYTL